MFSTRYLALILAPACVCPTWAGMDKEGSSQRPGLFCAWLSPDDGPVWAHFENPAHHAATGAALPYRRAGVCAAGRHPLPVQGSITTEVRRPGRTLHRRADHASSRGFQSPDSTPTLRASTCATPKRL